jgi:hypothetical protein
MTTPRFFIAVRQARPGATDPSTSAPALLLASHPADAERTAYFERAAQKR